MHCKEKACEHCDDSRYGLAFYYRVRGKEQNKYIDNLCDGYRYADNITAHMFTVDPGIIDYNGKLHFDFYKTDGMIPWAWTEITYSKTDDSDVIPYLRNSEFGWY